MCMMLKPKFNRHSLRGKGLLNLTYESVKVQGDFCCDFCLEKHFLSRICTTLSDGKQTVIPGSCSAFDGCCAQEEP